MMPAERFVPQTPEERALWDWVKSQPKFQLKTLKQAMAFSDYRVERIWSVLRRKNIVRSLGQAGGKQWFSVHDDAEIEAVKRGKRKSMTGRVWAVMRATQTFTVTDLVMSFDVELDDQQRHKIREFCRALVAAEYLKVIQKARPDVGREACYRLVKNTGPIPPSFGRRLSLIDQNTERVVWVAGGAL
ncbi:MAG: hypothetical protein AAGM84_05450 [Pseudomonadota bacterium]